VEAGVSLLLVLLLVLVLETPCKIADENDDDMTRRWVTRKS